LSQGSSDWLINDLLVRLKDESAQSLITRLISIEEGKLTDPARIFQDCIEKIQNEKQKKDRAQLIEAIRQAETLKDAEKLNQLKEKFNESLKNQLRSPHVWG